MSHPPPDVSSQRGAGFEPTMIGSQGLNKVTQKTTCPESPVFKRSVENLDEDRAKASLMAREREEEEEGPRRAKGELRSRGAEERHRVQPWGEVSPPLGASASPLPSLSGN
ncbi:hypothetical protein EYF80_039595 [Liparis tanakae]|uniref:Uncharacterized protein n=1 Tax=Liparis tanakae TaxID=230148 RepID=A0A4Z2GAD0_9TELE|nr:hypothetical protein EYF80_039595 [Liparis tanakae]